MLRCPANIVVAPYSFRLICASLARKSRHSLYVVLAVRNNPEKFRVFPTLPKSKMTSSEYQRQACEVALLDGAVNGVIDEVRRAISLMGFPADVGGVSEILRTTTNCADDSVQKDTAIHLAATGDHVDILALLLDADPGLLNLRNAVGLTPLHKAACAVSLRSIRYLVGRGADLEAADNNYGETPLCHATWAVDRSIRTDAVHLLVSLGADIGFVNPEVGGVLHCVIGSAGGSSHETLAMADVLLQCGAPVDPQCSIEDPVIFMAAEDDHEELVQLLLRWGAAPDALSRREGSHGELTTCIFEAEGTCLAMLLQVGVEECLSKCLL